MGADIKPRHYKETAGRLKPSFDGLARSVSGGGK